MFVLPESAIGGEDEFTAIKGGITEDVMSLKDKRQLLASMEKLAGDLAFECLKLGCQFEAIIILGLIINFNKEICEVFELTMNFLNKQSNFKIGYETLPINDAINQMITALETPSAVN